MDIEGIRTLLDELAAFMKKHNLSELELDVDGAKVKLSKAAGAPAVAVVHPAQPASAPAGSAAPTYSATPAPQEPEHEPGTVPITSPMVGTFYRAGKPDADPFVEVGDEVNEDTVLCIIEAMKVMNEIKADRKGRIVRILAENGDPVEYGQPLFLIATS